jgi:hypothetical protein
MLHEFLTANRSELLARCAARVDRRHTPKLSDVELQHGMPLFLDQFIETLQAEERAPELLPRRKNSIVSEKGRAGSEMAVSATRHGRELMQRGFTVEQVVRDYGDVCQEITDLAMERGVPIQVGEFQKLNLCLDNGMQTP